MPTLKHRTAVFILGASLQWIGVARLLAQPPGPLAPLASSEHVLDSSMVHSCGSLLSPQSRTRSPSLFEVADQQSATTAEHPPSDVRAIGSVKAGGIPVIPLHKTRGFLILNNTRSQTTFTGDGGPTLLDGLSAVSVSTSEVASSPPASATNDDPFMLGTWAASSSTSRRARSTVAYYAISGAPQPEQLVSLTFLLREPYRCVAEPEALLSQKFPSETQDSFEAFVEMHGFDLELLKRDDCRTIEQRKVRDELLPRLRDSVSQITRHLTYERPENALQELKRLQAMGPGIPPPNACVARTYFSWANTEYHELGRDHLNAAFAAERNSPQTFLVAADLAFKERRWVDAEMHYEAAKRILESNEPMSKSFRAALRRRVWLSLLASSEQARNWHGAESAVAALLAADPHDSTALLHRAVIICLSTQKQLPDSFIETARDHLIEARRWERPVDDKDREAESFPLPELLLIELLTRTGRSREARLEWTRLKSRRADLESDPEVAFDVYLAAARWFLAEGELGDTHEFLTLADNALPANSRTDRFKVKFFATVAYFANSDLTIEMLGKSFSQLPSDREIANMYAIQLLASSDAELRTRGFKLAELNAHANAEWPTAQITFGYAQIVEGDNEAAQRQVADVLKGVLRPPRSYSLVTGLEVTPMKSPDDMYLLGIILSKNSDHALSSVVATNLIREAVGSTAPFRFRIQAEKLMYPPVPGRNKSNAKPAP